MVVLVVVLCCVVVEKGCIEEVEGGRERKRERERGQEVICGWV